MPQLLTPEARARLERLIASGLFSRPTTDGLRAALDELDAWADDARRMAEHWERVALAIDDSLPADDSDYGAPSQDRDFATARTLRDCAAEWRIIVAQHTP